jgi:TATA-binding protein-associated factor
MPSQTAASALLDLYFVVDGAPWCWPSWKNITGVRHGLFPKTDDKLPSGWTREDANDIHSWFIHCHSAKSAENGAASMPGRTKWNRFVQTKWEQWQLHAIIVKALRDCGIHPIQIIVNEGTTGFEWPKADSYAPNAFESIGMLIFGSDALGQAELFPANIRKCIATFIQRSWARIRIQIQTDKKRLELLEIEALAAFNRAYAPLNGSFFMFIEPLGSRDRRRNCH